MEPALISLTISLTLLVACNIFLLWNIQKRKRIDRSDKLDIKYEEDMERDCITRLYAYLESDRFLFSNESYILRRHIQDIYNLNPREISKTEIEMYSMGLIELGSFTDVTEKGMKDFKELKRKYISIYGNKRQDKRT